MEIQIVLPAKKTALAVTVDELSSATERRIRLPWDAHHLVFLQSGNIVVQDSARKRETFEARATLLIRGEPGTDSFLETGSGVQGAVLGFSGSTLEALSSLDADSYIFNIFAGRHKESVSASFDDALSSSCSKRLSELLRHMSETKPGRNALALAAILQVSVDSANAFAIAAAPQEKAEPEGVWSIEQVIKYIESNYAEAFSLEWFVKKCAMNTSDFSRRFKESAGCPLFEFINRRRIDRACHLLKNSDLPVIDIAMSIGFTNLSFFNRYFLRIMDDSPRSWRTKARR